jgi:hypothetical protein
MFEGCQNLKGVLGSGFLAASSDLIIIIDALTICRLRLLGIDSERANI